jgi:hypothetical protein
MSTRREPDWTTLCAGAGVDPTEIRMVWARYQAYQRFYEEGRRQTPLSLEDWFKWYRMEVASETDSRTASPGGCSVDSDARNQGSVRNPGAVLDVLRQLSRDHGAGAA